MEVFNNGGSVTIVDMPRNMYNAINKILDRVENGFEKQSEEYVLKEFEPCSLTTDEKDALDRECWMI